MKTLKKLARFALETVAVMIPVVLGAAALYLAPSLMTLGTAFGGLVLSIVVMSELDENAI